MEISDAVFPVSYLEGTVIRFSYEIFHYVIVLVFPDTGKDPRASRDK